MCLSFVQTATLANSLIPEEVGKSVTFCYPVFFSFLDNVPPVSIFNEALES